MMSYDIYFCFLLDICVFYWKSSNLRLDHYFVYSEERKEGLKISKLLHRFRDISDVFQQKVQMIQVQHSESLQSCCLSMLNKDEIIHCVTLSFIFVGNHSS